MQRLDTSDRDSAVIVCLIVIFIIQIIATAFKNKYRRWLKSEFSYVSEAAQSDRYLDYYRKMQLVDIYRVVMTIILLGVIMWRTDSTIVQSLAIALWAIILVFQSLIMSFVIYLMLLSQYKVWETIKVGELGEWEIITIKPLHIGLAGRNRSWEHTGEFYLIPNNKVRENPIIKVDYNLNSYQKISCTTYYRSDRFECSFDDYLDRLTGFLEALLPSRTARNVWHYKSYIWHKYKINYEMHSDGAMEVSIWFIIKQRNSDDMKRQIYSFVQGL